MITLTHPGGGKVIIVDNTYTTYFNNRLFHQATLSPQEKTQTLNRLLHKGYSYEHD